MVNHFDLGGCHLDGIDGLGSAGRAAAGAIAAADAFVSELFGSSGSATAGRPSFVWPFR
jgi:hypothetical protein